MNATTRRAVLMLSAAVAVSVCGSSGSSGGESPKREDPKETGRRLDEAIEFLALRLQERMDHADAARGRTAVPWKESRGTLSPGGGVRSTMAPSARDLGGSMGAGERGTKVR